MTKLQELYSVATPRLWYSKTTNKGSAHEQGLVISEAVRSGHVAVTYDPKDAPVISHAVNMLPKLVEALEEVDRGAFSGDEIRARKIASLVKAVLAEANNPEVPQ